MSADKNNPGLSGKVAIVTGATSGIGREIALRLAIEGVKLAVCGRSDEKMQSLLSELGQAQVYAEMFCVTDENRIVSFIEAVKGRFGCIDILINNAGLNSARGKMCDVRGADVDYMMAVNFKAPLLFTKEVLKSMRQRRAGHIVNIISTAALFGNDGIGLYSATKAALDSATGVLRKEVRSEGIRVSAVYPGGVNSAFRPEPRPEYMNPASVANAVFYLLNSPPDAVVHEVILRPPSENNYP